MKKKIFIITGEESGDIRASELVNELNLEKLEIHATGGKHLMKAGVKIVYPIKKLGGLGLLEILTKLPAILRFKSFLKKYILSFQPHIVILVDYPGFNIPFLKWLKKRGFKTVYYVLPKVWAHGSNRIKPIRRYSDLMLSIIPFEKDLFGENCYYIGNPILNRVKNVQEKNYDKKYIGIFPGSRLQEIKFILPVMLKTARLFTNELFILNIPHKVAKETKRIVNKSGLDILIKEDMYYDSLLQCKYAIITSGTATLEAALLKIPFIIVYKLNWLTFLILKAVAKIKYIGLPNILLNKPAFKEFIQNNAKPELMKTYIEKELNDPKLYGRIEKYSNELYNVIGNIDMKLGAEKILQLMEDNNV